MWFGFVLLLYVCPENRCHKIESKYRIVVISWALGSDSSKIGGVCVYVHIFVCIEERASERGEGVYVQHEYTYTVAHGEKEEQLWW